MRLIPSIPVDCSLSNQEAFAIFMLENGADSHEADCKLPMLFYAMKKGLTEVRHTAGHEHQTVVGTRRWNTLAYGRANTITLPAAGGVGQNADVLPEIRATYCFPSSA
jgi:hypothetical protein